MPLKLLATGKAPPTAISSAKAVGVLLAPAHICIFVAMVLYVIDKLPLVDTWTSVRRLLTDVRLRFSSIV